MKVVMDVPISGGRADGTHWPPAGGVLEVEDWEGAELCAAGLAHPHAEERKAETRPAPATEEKRTAEVQQPAVNAPKADWVAYAVAQGANAAEAGSLTKQQLTGRYGTS